MRASRVRMSRNERRTLRRKVRLTIRMSGITEKVTISSSALSRPIAITMPTTVNRSPKMAITPAVASSFRASTSFVTRVMRRPIGVRS